MAQPSPPLLNLNTQSQHTITTRELTHFHTAFRAKHRTSIHLPTTTSCTTVPPVVYSSQPAHSSFTPHQTAYRSSTATPPKHTQELKTGVMSLPWAIQDIHLPAEETKGQQRRSIFNEDPWALRKCQQCHEVSRCGVRSVPERSCLLVILLSTYAYMRTINIFC